MRIDSNHSSSGCTRPRNNSPIEHARVYRPAVDRDDRFDVTAPEHIRGPRIEDLQPRFCPAPPSSSSSSGAGYSPTPVASDRGGSIETQKACLDHMAQLHGHLTNIKQQYVEWKQANPHAPEPTDGDKTMGEILELPVHEQCVRILCVVIHEQPQVLEDPAIHASPEAGIPSNEVPGQAPVGGDFLSQMGQMFGPLAQMLGGFLSSPLATPILMAAANLIPPPVGQVVMAAVPFLAPIAGQVLSGLGSGAGGQSAGAPSAGVPDLGALIGGVSGLLGGAGGVAAPAPVPA
jgi:hypothetical protein